MLNNTSKLKLRALNEWYLCACDMPDVQYPDGAKYVSIPFLFNGIVNKVEYNTKTKRFEKIHLRMENMQDEIIDIPN